MDKMTPRERVLCVLAGEIPDRVPYFEIGIDFPFVCQLLGLDLPSGKYFEAGEYASAPVDIQLQINQILHRDILVYNMLPPIPAIKHVGKDRILFFSDGKVKSWEDLDLITLPDPTSEEVLAPARDFLAQKGEYATVCASRTGISAAYLAMGMEHFFLALHDQPQLIQELLRRYTEFAAKVVEVAADLGFDIFWTSDDIAYKSGPFISPLMFRKLIIPHIMKVSDRVKECGIPWGFHSDGNLEPILHDLLALGICALNPIEPLCMDIRKVKETIGDKVTLIGNVDVNLLASGTPKQVREVTLGLLCNVASEGRYMFASGNSVTSFCLLENVLSMCETLFHYGEYPIRIPN